MIAARGATDGRLCCGSFLSIRVHLFKARGRDGTPTGTFMRIHRKPEAGGAAAKDPLSTEQSALSPRTREFTLLSQNNRRRRGRKGGGLRSGAKKASNIGWEGMPKGIWSVDLARPTLTVIVRGLGEHQSARISWRAGVEKQQPKQNNLCLCL